MRYVLIATIIALIGSTIGIIGFDYYYQYTQEQELENLIVSCMEQYGHYSEKLVSCLNDNTPSSIQITQDRWEDLGIETP
jgi:hypothetical protein